MRKSFAELTGLEFKRPQTEEEGTVYLLLPVAVYLTAMLLTAVSGMTFVLIAGSDVHFIVAMLSTAVLCMLPAFVIKALTGLMGYTNRALLTVLTALGFIAGLLPVGAYYVSHDYELSVYRYMRVTAADEYYYGGYDALENDYVSIEEFIGEMKDTSASVMLSGMSVDKLSEISPDQIELLNSQSLWEYFNFDDILGDDPDEIEDSLTASRSMNAYEFTFEYRGLTAKTFLYMFAHPRQTLREIGMMHRTGTRFVTPQTLLTYLLGQIFSVYMLCMHFGINEKDQIVYYTRPAPLTYTMNFLRLLVNSVREMAADWKMK